MMNHKIFTISYNGYDIEIFEENYISESPTLFGVTECCKKALDADEIKKQHIDGVAEIKYRYYGEEKQTVFIVPPDECRAVSAHNIFALLKSCVAMIRYSTGEQPQTDDEFFAMLDCLKYVTPCWENIIMEMLLANERELKRRQHEKN